MVIPISDSDARSNVATAAVVTCLARQYGNSLPFVQYFYYFVDLITVVGSLSLSFFHHPQLKVLKIVTKNLADPVKSREEKYRQLRLDNEKIQQKLMPCNPHALLYLQSLGFVEQEAQVLTCAAPPSLVPVQAALEQVMQALQGLEGPDSNDNNNNAKRTFQHQSSSLSSSSSSSTTEKLSEKQKARRLLEEKERAEKEEARRRRKATSQLIQQDKYVRKYDENWTSGPSAAVHKSGTAIATFRDRHGEN